MHGSAKTTIGQIAVENRGAIPLFERLGLDYYRHGDRTLQQACRVAGQGYEEVLQELGKTPVELARSSEPSWEEASLTEVVHFIVNQHHAFVRSQLGAMEKAFEDLDEGHDQPSQAAVLRELFLKLDVKLRDHLLQEETEVFPRLIWAERRTLSGDGPGAVEEADEELFSAVRHVLLYHRMMDEEFIQMKKVLYHFIHLSPGSDFLKRLGEVVEAMDHNNHRHIHLENNVLLRKAVRLGILREQDHKPPR